MVLVAEQSLSMENYVSMLKWFFFQGAIPEICHLISSVTSDMDGTHATLYKAKDGC